MLKIVARKQFKKDLKRVLKDKRYSMKMLEDVLDLLTSGQQLPAKYADHALTGNYKGYRDCHIAPDWMLIYKIEHDKLILLLTRTGSHSELF